MLQTNGRSPLFKKRFMGGSLYELFYFSLHSSTYEKDFLQEFIKLSQASLLKIFNFSDLLKVQKRVYYSLKFRGVYLDILATVSRLNTLYGLETLYLHLDTLESLKNFRGFSDVFDVFMTSSISGFYVFCSFLLQQLS